MDDDEDLIVMDDEVDNDWTPGGLLPRVTLRTGFREPVKFDSATAFKECMLEAQAHGAADVYIQPNYPICGRINGDLMAITRRALDTKEVQNILLWATGRDSAFESIITGKAVNGRFELFDPDKRDRRGAKVRYGYRVNASAVRSFGGVSSQIVMRSIPNTPPLFSDLGLDETMVRQMTPRDGIGYIAGKTGSGKTTTIASVIRYILENDTAIKGNILSHEDPIEYVFDSIQSRHSIVVQSQIGLHFDTFDDATREAMRRAPAMVYLGEMRDEASIRAGTELSLTGHLVLGTVHANDCASVMRRQISRFPDDERATAIYDIVDTCRFILCQRLVKGRDGKLLAAREFLVFNDEVRTVLSDLSEMGQVTARIREMVEAHGRSFRAEAERLLALGKIDEHVARSLTA